MNRANHKKEQMNTYLKSQTSNFHPSLPSPRSSRRWRGSGASVCVFPPLLHSRGTTCQRNGESHFLFLWTGFLLLSLYPHLFFVVNTHEISTNLPLLLLIASKKYPYLASCLACLLTPLTPPRSTQPCGQKWSYRWSWPWWWPPSPSTHRRVRPCRRRRTRRPLRPTFAARPAASFPTTRYGPFLSLFLTPQK